MDQLVRIARNSINVLSGGFSAFVFLFSSLTFFCATFYTFHSRYNIDPYAIYALIVLFAVFIAATKSLFLNPEEKWKYTNHEALFILAVFLFGMALGLYRIHAFGVWLDEEGQLQATSGAVRMGIVYAAAGSQQMPLSYYFSALNKDLLGITELGVRLFPCLFYAGSGPLFYRLTRRLCTNPLMYSAAPFIYLLNPWMIRYAQEGRPYGCVLFCGILWLNATCDLLSSPEEGGGLTKRKLILFSCALLFLFSTSFQPVILLVSFLPPIGLLGCSPRWRKRAAAFFGVTALAIMAVLPLIYLARASSMQFMRTTISLDVLAQLPVILRSLPDFASELFRGQSYLLALVLLLLVPLFLAYPARRLGELLLVGAGGFLVFLVSFVCIFSLLINYRIFVRYYIIAYPLGLLVIIASLDWAVAFFKKYGADLILLKSWQGIFIAVLLVPEFGTLPDVYFSTKLDRWNIDDKAIFQYFREQGSPGDVAYVIPYQEPGNWEHAGFLTTQFYYRENTPVLLSNHWETDWQDTVSDLILKDLATKRPKNIFLTFTGWWADEDFVNYASRRPNLEHLSGRKFIVYKLVANGSVPQALQTFFSDLVHSVRNKENAYRIFDILLRLAEYEKDSPKCFSYLNELKSVNSNNPVMRKIIQDHEERCRSLAVRNKAAFRHETPASRPSP